MRKCGIAGMEMRKMENADCGNLRNGEYEISQSRISAILLLSFFLIKQPQRIQQQISITQRLNLYCILFS